MRRVWILAVIVVLGLGLVLAVATAALGYAWNRVEQPIAFNHRVHIEEVGFECTDCHLYAKTGVRATIPNIEICEACHADAEDASPGVVRTVEYVERSEPIPWRKVYRVPNHVYFSHRRHTAMAGIACEECHGEVGQRTEPVDRPAVAPTMERCLDCHDERGASNDCLWCHR